MIIGKTWESKAKIRREKYKEKLRKARPTRVFLLLPESLAEDGRIVLWQYVWRIGVISQDGSFSRLEYYQTEEGAINSYSDYFDRALCSIRNIIETT